MERTIYYLTLVTGILLIFLLQKRSLIRREVLLAQQIASSRGWQSTLKASTWKYTPSFQGTCSDGRGWQAGFLETSDWFIPDERLLVWTTGKFPDSDMGLIQMIGFLDASTSAQNFQAVFCLFQSTNGQISTKHIPLAQVDDFLRAADQLDQLCWIRLNGQEMEVGLKAKHRSVQALEQLIGVCCKLYQDVDRLLE